MDLLQYIGSLGGITGVLAVLMGLAYRADRKYTENRFVLLVKQYEARFTELCSDYKEVVRENTAVKEKMATALNELTTWLQSRNGHKPKTAPSHTTSPKTPIKS
jgi:hypothetical protein